MTADVVGDGQHAGLAPEQSERTRQRNGDDQLQRTHSAPTQPWLGPPGPHSLDQILVCLSDSPWQPPRHRPRAAVAAARPQGRPDLSSGQGRASWRCRAAVRVIARLAITVDARRPSRRGRTSVVTLAVRADPVRVRRLSDKEGRRAHRLVRRAEARRRSSVVRRVGREACASNRVDVDENATSTRTARSRVRRERSPNCSRSTTPNGASPQPDESVFAPRSRRWPQVPGWGEVPDFRPREKKALLPTLLLADLEPLRSEPSPAPS